MMIMAIVIVLTKKNNVKDMYNNNTNHDANNQLYQHSSKKSPRPACAVPGPGPRRGPTGARRAAPAPPLAARPSVLKW